MKAKRNITNDLVTDYINGFYAPLTDELGKLRVDSEEKNVPIILKETESFLKTFLGVIKPARILEIGCAVGYSAMFFAQLTGAEVYTIEKNFEMVETAVKNIESLGYAEKINVFEGDGEEIAELLKKEVRNRLMSYLSMPQKATTKGFLMHAFRCAGLIR